MAESKINTSAIPNSQPVSTSAARQDFGDQNVDTGHNKVRTQSPASSARDNEVEVKPVADKMSHPAGSVVVNPEQDAAQRTVNSATGAAIGGNAESTLRGATSADFTSSIGQPIGGVSSREAHHPGHATQNDALDRTAKNR
ncbi:hypothetical protein PYCC9005_004833 [Savitreella phatthalungensis]